MQPMIGLKPMKTSEAVKIHLALNGHEPFGRPFQQVLETTQMEPRRLRDLLETYHFYFTPVGQSDRFIINRLHHDQGSLFTIIDAVERRNVRFALAKFTPVFFIAVILGSATLGFLLSAIVNQRSLYF